VWPPVVGGTAATAYNRVVANPLRSLRQPEERLETLGTARRVARVLDSLFEIPLIKVRFGLDAIAGLIPGVGDLTTPVFSSYLLFQAFRMRVPKIVLLRMLMNVGLDALVGLVPIVGDLFDIGWKANLRNMALLERHADPFSEPTRGDYVFVALILGLVLCCALVPLVLFIVLLYWVGILGHVPLV
jgi:Domain of unknown function (DUF4112)